MLMIIAKGFTKFLKRKNWINYNIGSGVNLNNIQISKELLEFQKSILKLDQILKLLL